MGSPRSLLAYPLSPGQIGKCSDQRHGWPVEKECHWPEECEDLDSSLRQYHSNQTCLLVVLATSGLLGVGPVGSLQGYSRTIKKDLKMVVWIQGRGRVRYTDREGT